MAVQGLAARMMETLTYTYDVMNRRTGETRSSAPARTFGYDLTGQLTAVNQSSGNATFAYDAAGNRTTVTGAPGAGSYTANSLNQYTTAGGVGPLTYDANGNLATGGGWTYTHNGNNRLVGVSGPATASFGRDGRNRDVKRTINGVTTYLIYDGWNLIAEYNGAGVLTTQYIHGPQVDEILAKATPTSTTFPLPDALGSTIAVTDQSGALMERVYYTDAFGTPTFKNGSGATLAGTTTGTRFLFTGREWLSQFGLYDYRNRTYSAAFGRFVEKDPIGFRAGDLNLYRYVANNPINAVDPLGLDAWTIGPISFPGPGPNIPGQWDHEAEHRRQFWDGRRFTEPAWKLEQEAFQAQADALKKQIDDTKSKGGCPSNELQSAYEDAKWGATEDGAKAYQDQVDQLNPVRNAIKSMNENFFDRTALGSD